MDAPDTTAEPSPAVAAGRREADGVTLGIPRPPYFEFRDEACAWCNCNPCLCERERIERCACGSSLVVWEPCSPEIVRRIVVAHQVSEPHASWSEATYAPHGSGPRTEPPDVDLSAGTPASSAAAVGGRP